MMQKYKKNSQTKTFLIVNMSKVYRTRKAEQRQSNQAHQFRNQKHRHSE